MTASLAPEPADAPRARTSFEWLTGKRFVVQRLEVEHPDAPDGIAIIGSDAAGGGYLQHYLDSRGVARVYEMTFADNVWTLERDVAARDFSQRFTGTFDDDRNVMWATGRVRAMARTGSPTSISPTRARIRPRRTAEARCRRRRARRVRSLHPAGSRKARKSGTVA